MTQSLRTFIAGKSLYLELPDAHAELLPGVRWGRLDYLFTPAFWATQAVLQERPRASAAFRIGTTLAEEVTACMLGGHGIPAEMGLAAFRCLRDEGLIREGVREQELHSVLSRPLTIRDRQVSYRFARQKSRYLAEILSLLDSDELTVLSDLAFRDWLTSLPGIGLKTASWITRNYRASNQIAVIDIHVYRAGRIAGWIPAENKIQRDYLDIEKQFLDFSHAIGVEPIILDSIIWDFMRQVGDVALEAYAGTQERDPPGRKYLRAKDRSPKANNATPRFQKGR